MQTCPPALEKIPDDPLLSMKMEETKAEKSFSLGSKK